MADEQDRRQVKVVDRRWFTPEGEPRPGFTFEGSETDSTEATEVLLPAPVPAPPVKEASRVALPPQALQDTIGFLAEYAMAFMTGQAPGVPRNPEAARLYVDLLAEVQERTRAHASLQEAKVLDDVLSQLRLRLVATTR